MLDEPHRKTALPPSRETQCPTSKQKLALQDLHNLSYPLGEAAEAPARQRYP